MSAEGESRIWRRRGWIRGHEARTELLRICGTWGWPFAWIGRVGERDQRLSLHGAGNRSSRGQRRCKFTIVRECRILGIERRSDRGPPGRRQGRSGREAREGRGCPKREWPWSDPPMARQPGLTSRAGVCNCTGHWAARAPHPSQTGQGLSTDSPLLRTARRWPKPLGDLHIDDGACAVRCLSSCPLITYPPPPSSSSGHPSSGPDPVTMTMMARILTSSHDRRRASTYRGAPSRLIVPVERGSVCSLCLLISYR